ncbi:MAG: hypothetical protein AAGJ80_01280 [Cyanobacteria bacterium J06553_1]
MKGGRDRGAEEAMREEEACSSMAVSRAMSTRSKTIIVWRRGGEPRAVIEAEELMEAVI